MVNLLFTPDGPDGQILRTIQRTMIAECNMGMPTMSLVPDCKLLNPNVGGKPQPFRNRQVIGSSPIVGSIT